MGGLPSICQVRPLYRYSRSGSSRVPSPAVSPISSRPYGSQMIAFWPAAGPISAAHFSQSAPWFCALSNASKARPASAKRSVILRQHIPELGLGVRPQRHARPVVAGEEIGEIVKQPIQDHGHIGPLQFNALRQAMK